MTARERVKQLIKVWPKVYPDAHTELDFRNPLQLLVATILSAQCTDKRVNMVTPSLFRKYRTAKDYANAPQVEFENTIKSTGFYRSKTKSIRGAMRAIAEVHGGRVPDTMEELCALPGVGRKTANVVLGNAFHKNEGVVVDTHVIRLSQRLGLTKHKDAEKIERDLMKLVPREQCADDLIKFEMHCFGVTILCVLNQKYHQECDNRRSSVDDQLPGVGKMKSRSRKKPDTNDKHSSSKCPGAAEHHGRTAREVAFLFVLF